MRLLVYWAAAVCWASYIVFGKRLGHLHAGHSVALGLSVAALTVVPFGIWHAGAALLQPHILLYGLGVAAVSSAMGPSQQSARAIRVAPSQLRVAVMRGPRWRGGWRR